MRGSRSSVGEGEGKVGKFCLLVKYGIFRLIGQMARIISLLLALNAAFVKLLWLFAVSLELFFLFVAAVFSLYLQSMVK